jgi:hypothetical protein
VSDQRALLQAYIYVGTSLSSVGIVIGYGLDGQGSIPSRGKKLLLLCSIQIGLGPTQPLVQFILGAISTGGRGVKQQGKGTGETD